MTGAALLRLQGILHVVADRRPHRIRLMADHHDHTLRAHRARRIHRVARHRLAADRVRCLWQLRLHPGPLPGSENDGDDRMTYSTSLNLH